MDLWIAIGLLTAVWLVLATLIRWGLRWLLARRSATALWVTGLFVSAGVIGLALLLLAPIGERSIKLMLSLPASRVPTSESSLPSSAPPPSTAPAEPAAEPPPPPDFKASGQTGAASAYPQFPWPPAPPSAETVVPNQVLLAGLRQAVRLGDISQVLVNALENAGYYQNVYYEVPHGFALVARLERIYPDGSSYQGTARFDSSFFPLPAFSLAGYLRALFQAPTGYYRVIAFIVSDTPFAANGKPISSSEADIWLERGANALPVRIADTAYSATYTCTALIYEFEKHDARSDPIEDLPGPLSADAHLVKAKIAETLGWPLY